MAFGGLIEPPKEQLVVIYMIQVSDGDRIYLRNQFRSLVTQTLVDRR